MFTAPMPGTSSKTTTISIRMPNDLLVELRKKARRKHVSVASLIVKSVRETIRKDNDNIR
jgi:hypothetical protein